MTRFILHNCVELVNDLVRFSENGLSHYGPADDNTRTA